MTFLLFKLFKLKNIDKTEDKESKETISKEAIKKATEIEKNKQNNLKSNFNSRFKINNQQNINKTAEQKIEPINFEL